MRLLSRKQLAAVLLPSAIVLAIGFIGGSAGYRLNLTASLPIGLWRITDDIGPGTYVTACVPPAVPMMRVAVARGYLPDGMCPGGYAPLLKQVAAVAGDTVTLTADAVAINGQVLPNTRTLNATGPGRLPVFPRGTYQVGADEFWLIANHNPRSFDSRYFGALRRADIRHGMKPIAVH